MRCRLQELWAARGSRFLARNGDIRDISQSGRRSLDNSVPQPVPDPGGNELIGSRQVDGLFLDLSLQGLNPYLKNSGFE